VGKERDAYPLALSGNPVHIIVTQRDAEYNTRDTFELIDPLFPFAVLTINLEYSDRQLAQVEVGFQNSPFGGMKNVFD
jgi:hypothetical protein